MDLKKIAIDGPPELMRIVKQKKIIPERGGRLPHTSEDETFRSGVDPVFLFPSLCHRY
jgi:hypothetical protein